MSESLSVEPDTERLQAIRAALEAFSISSDAEIGRVVARELARATRSAAAWLERALGDTFEVLGAVGPGAPTPGSRRERDPDTPGAQAHPFVAGASRGRVVVLRATAFDPLVVDAFAALAGHALEVARARREHLAARAEAEHVLAVVGHDLRTPLTAIDATAAMLARDPACERAVPGLGRIRQITARTMRLVAQLLDVARLRNGGLLDMHPRPGDLAAVCRRVLGEFDVTWPGRIVCEVTGDLHGLWDEDRLGQALSNLVGNALDHGDRDAPVTVRVDGSRDDVVEIRVHNAGVVDPALLPRLFDPLRATQRTGHGVHLGLGLFIMRAVILAHGGTVDVTSQQEAGTEFVVRLPRLRVELPRPL